MGITGAKTTEAVEALVKVELADEGPGSEALVNVRMAMLRNQLTSKNPTVRVGNELIELATPTIGRETTGPARENEGTPERPSAQGRCPNEDSRNTRGPNRSNRR